MQKELFKLITIDFGKRLTTFEYNQYIPKLRDYFVDFVLERKSYCNNIERLFKDEFTRNDLIMSTVYYIINNQNVESKSAIDDFLIALNRFFDETVFDIYSNTTLARLKPFASLADEVEIELTKMNVQLKNREAYPPINDLQFEFINSFIKQYETNRLRSYEAKVITKLLLLYGLSFDRISIMKLSDYDSLRRTLRVNYLRTVERYIYLELPYSLAKDFDDYLNVRNQDEMLNSELLFITETNNAITNSVTQDLLNTIKNNYEDYIGAAILGKNPFTQTGLQKYAIINMILEGMNQSVIIDLTGHGEQIFNDCQNIVDESKKLDRNRYINHMVRGIKTFDLI